ncbi:protein-tyrosine phosphatase [Batrachochytrium dendrobatidis JEL423]|uniref:protein-tyrosine-phosphatase n=2 Tax=Batrachochytrium dendrobatidis TaxID=109871 RepID=A0A177WAR5_BATDL|nr:protein-tyrosine phosphatase [Batrachochytrium dendrobatidis JEL423]
MFASVPQLAKRRLRPDISLSINTLVNTANSTLSPDQATSASRKFKLAGITTNMNPTRLVTIEEPNSEFSVSNPYQHGPAPILKGPAGLYLGSAIAATNFQYMNSLAIQCVVNVAKEIDVGTTVAPIEGCIGTPNVSEFPTFQDISSSCHHIGTNRNFFSPHASPNASTVMSPTITMTESRHCFDRMPVFHSPCPMSASAALSSCTSLSPFASTCMPSPNVYGGHHNWSANAISMSATETLCIRESASSASTTQSHRPHTLPNHSNFLQGKSLYGCTPAQTDGPSKSRRQSLNQPAAAQQLQSGLVRHYKFAWAHNQDLSTSLDAAIQVIQQARDSGQSVLVHCQQGVSRSAALVIAYVMKSQHMQFQDAYALVKECAPHISPNVNLVAQLVEFEQLWNISSKLHQQLNQPHNHPRSCEHYTALRSPSNISAA